MHSTPQEEYGRFICGWSGSYASSSSSCYAWPPSAAMIRCKRCLASSATAPSCSLPTIPSIACGSATSTRLPEPSERTTTLQGSSGRYPVLAQVRGAPAEDCRHHQEAEITLIDSTGKHAYMPGWLYLPFNHVSVESDQLVRPERDLLNNHVHLVTGEVHKIDPQNRELQVRQSLGLDEIIM